MSYSAPGTRKKSSERQKPPPGNSPSAFLQLHLIVLALPWGDRPCFNAHRKGSELQCFAFLFSEDPSVGADTRRSRGGASSPGESSPTLSPARCNSRREVQHPPAPFPHCPIPYFLFWHHLEISFLFPYTDLEQRSWWTEQRWFWSDAPCEPHGPPWAPSLSLVPPGSGDNSPGTTICFQLIRAESTAPNFQFFRLNSAPEIPFTFLYFLS